ncbi:hypothetical protein Cantr_06438 [Candida viswanathii]|uniref:Uncharacterized protein n=1 Tax=Candida viswanathii TaxID=5486 RepID=A0A367XWS7_9ASCO|nr:hypothetical protein Cantr_06438 [Candida viswanathii]
MNHSYIYTKKFIDDQVNILNEPFQITPEMRGILDDSLSEDQLQLVLNKINNDLLQRNERLFPAQINNQIILQIMKLETQKLKIVNQQLFKVNSFVKPIILPDFDNLSDQDQNEKLVELIDMIEELPELKYLFAEAPQVANVDEDYSIEEEEEGGDLEVGDNTIQDDQDTAESRKQVNREFIEEIIDEVNELNETPGQELIDKYDKLRGNLIELSKRLKYKNDKLNYLNNLKQNLSKLFNLNQSPTEPQSNEIYDSDEETGEKPDVDGLQSNLRFNETAAPESQSMASEINRFRILVEQISYKVNTKGITGAELREKLQQLD